MCALLSKWSNLERLQKALPKTIRAFYYRHKVRHEETIQKRLAVISKAVPLTNDAAIVRSGEMVVQMLVGQIRQLNKAIDRFDTRLKQLLSQHPDADFFRNLPGAGDALTPRLVAAFGTDRERFETADQLQCLGGTAPVTKRSGKTTIVTRRFACNKFLLQTFHEFARCSRQKSAWAQAYYDMLLDRGKHHHQAL